MRHPLKPVLGAALSLTLALGCSDTSTQTPSAPTPPPSPAPSGPGVSSVIVAGSTSFTQRGATAQWTATVTLTNGATENRTAGAIWLSDNPGVAAVSSQGLVTAQNDGDAFVSAIVSDVRGGRAVSVRTAPPPPVVRRTPDPPPGQRIPMPDVRAFVQQAASARPDLLVNQSCPRGLKYVTNPWLDYMVDQLRTLDTRWGYNGKPNRSAADNSGVPVVCAGDEVAYHYGAGPDQGSPDVYLIDILLGHCGPTPSLTFRVFTGEEPGRWTGAGRF